MSEAPKDGTPVVLLIDPADVPCIGWWWAEHGKWYFEDHTGGLSIDEDLIEAWWPIPPVPKPNAS